MPERQSGTGNIANVLVDLKRATAGLANELLEAAFIRYRAAIGFAIL
jgi:hypothetical protein